MLGLAERKGGCIPTFIDGCLACVGRCTPAPAESPQDGPERKQKPKEGWGRAARHLGFPAFSSAVAALILPMARKGIQDLLSESSAQLSQVCFQAKEEVRPEAQRFLYVVCGRVKTFGESAVTIQDGQRSLMLPLKGPYFDSIPLISERALPPLS